MESFRQFISSCLACIPGFGLEGQQETATTGEPVGIMEKRTNRKVGVDTTSDMKILDAEKESPDYSVFTVDALKMMNSGNQYPRLSKPKKGQLILVKSSDEQSKRKRQGIFPSLPKGPTSLVHSKKKQGLSPAVSRAVSAMQTALERFKSEDDSPVTAGSSVYQREGAMSTLLGVQNWEDVIEGREATRADTAADAREMAGPATSTPWTFRMSPASSSSSSSSSSQEDTSSHSCHSPSQAPASPRPPTPDLGITGIGYGGPSQRQLDKKYVLQNWFKRGVAEKKAPSESEKLPRNAAPFLIEDPVAWEIDLADNPCDEARRQRQQRKQMKINKLRQQLKSKSTADQPDERLRSNGATSAVMWEIDFADERSRESHQKRLTKRQKKLKELAKKKKAAAKYGERSQGPRKPPAPCDIYDGQDFKDALDF